MKRNHITTARRAPLSSSRYRTGIIGKLPDLRRFYYGIDGEGTAFLCNGQTRTPVTSIVPCTKIEGEGFYVRCVDNHYSILEVYNDMTNGESSIFRAGPRRNLTKHLIPPEVGDNFIVRRNLDACWLIAAPIGKCTRSEMLDFIKTYPQRCRLWVLSGNSRAVPHGFRNQGFLTFSEDRETARWSVSLTDNFLHYRPTTEHWNVSELVRHTGCRIVLDVGGYLKTIRGRYTIDTDRLMSTTIPVTVSPNQHYVDFKLLENTLINSGAITPCRVYS